MKLVHFLFFLFFFGLNANAFIAEPSSEKDSINEKCRYKWTQGGMLKKVIRPDKKHVDFTYDALGRRLTKTYKDQTTHFVWDGNVPLHEWTSGIDDAISQVNEDGEREIITPENLTTWVFEDRTFIPMAKMQGEKSYSIITDHLGTPTEAYDEEGKKVWSRQLNIYGETRKETGFENFIPFLFQGQYLDTETELAYNRYRYYSPESGIFISQDPIRLLSDEPNFYRYVKDSNGWVDVMGLNPLVGMDLGNMNRQQISEVLAGSDNISWRGGPPDNSRMAWNYSDTGNYAARIDPPDAVTQFDHIHLFDVDGNAIDINGNVVARNSPDAHIRIKCD